MNPWEPELMPRLEVEPFLKRYGVGRRRDKMEPLYREMLAEAERLVDPQVLLRECTLTEAASFEELLSERTAAVVLAICSLGPLLDEHENSLFPAEPHKAVVLNEIGTAQVTALTRSVRRFVQGEVAGRGLKAGPAYRPGVGNWPLELQRFVFEQLPADPIGVVLDEYLIMHPLKSNSLVIPLLNQTKK